jgi:hypothetical protein
MVAALTSKAIFNERVKTPAVKHALVFSQHGLDIAHNPPPAERRIRTFSLRISLRIFRKKLSFRQKGIAVRLMTYPVPHEHYEGEFEILGRRASDGGGMVKNER